MLSFGPFDHIAVKLSQRMAGVHDEHKAHETFATFQIVVDGLLPFDLFVTVCSSVAKTGKVYESASRIGIEKVQKLGTTRGFAHSCKFFRTGKAVNGAGLSGI